MPMMKLALTLAIAAVFLPCMQAALDLGSHQEEDVVGKWLKKHITKSQSSYEMVYFIMHRFIHVPLLQGFVVLQFSLAGSCLACIICS